MHGTSYHLLWMRVILEPDHPGGARLATLDHRSTTPFEPRGVCKLAWDSRRRSQHYRRDHCFGRPTGAPGLSAARKILSAFAEMCSPITPYGRFETGPRKPRSCLRQYTCRRSSLPQFTFSDRLFATARCLHLLLVTSGLTALHRNLLWLWACCSKWRRPSHRAPIDF